jgi:hypothetical protein
VWDRQLHVGELWPANTGGEGIAASLNGRCARSSRFFAQHR